MKELENILWNELGTKEDYFKFTEKENLAVFVRSIVGLEQQAINLKFGQFLAENVLNSRQQEFVKTIIIVSHDMNVISEHCTKVGVFSAGKLCVANTPKQVFSDYELIERLNLDLPTTAKIIKELNAKGIKIDCDLTVNDFVRAVKQKGDNR